MRHFLAAALLGLAILIPSAMAKVPPAGLKITSIDGSTLTVGGKPSRVYTLSTKCVISINNERSTLADVLVGDGVTSSHELEDGTTNQITLVRHGPVTHAHPFPGQAGFVKPAEPPAATAPSAASATPASPAVAPAAPVTEANKPPLDASSAAPNARAAISGW